MKTIWTLLACSVASVAAQAHTIDITTTPNWVEAHPYSKNIDPENRVNGSVYLHVGNQVSFLNQQKQAYSRYATAALNSEGVEDNSQITISFDPAYEKIELHSLLLWRDGKQINKLNDFEVKRFKQEEDLEKLLYNGEESYYLILKNVKEGDIVEYSFSRIGANPVFNGELSHWVRLGWSVPVGQTFSRVILPKNDDNKVRLSGDANSEDLIKSTHSNYTEYRYLVGQKQYDYYEDDQPAWYQPYPYLNVNSYGSWADVVDWALPLYQPQTSGERLDAELTRIKAIDGLDAQILAAIKTSQQTIRYLGIENGIGSHAPRTPEQVLKQGYGDCKDKTMLLVSLLNGLGVEASPALVSTNYRAKLLDEEPSHSAFDHVIVRFTHNGEEYWVDPTATEQADSIETIAQSRLKYGLVIKDGETQLTEIPNNSINDIIATTHFHVSGKTSVPSKMEVVTLYEGHQADRMRRYFSSQSQREIMKDYEEFFSNYWEDIQFSEQIVIEDDQDMNMIVVRENYVIDQMWYKDNNKKHVDIGSDIISTRFYKPESKRRTTPFALSSNINVKHKLIVHMPSSWDIRGELDQVRSPEFDFTMKMRGIGDYADQLSKQFKTIELDMEYEIKSDHVLPNRMNQYLKNVNEAQNSTWWTFSI